MSAYWKIEKFEIRIFRALGPVRGLVCHALSQWNYSHRTHKVFFHSSTTLFFKFCLRRVNIFLNKKKNSFLTHEGIMGGGRPPPIWACCCIKGEDEIPLPAGRPGICGGGRGFIGSAGEEGEKALRNCSKRSRQALLTEPAQQHEVNRRMEVKMFEKTRIIDHFKDGPRDNATCFGWMGLIIRG